MPRKKEKKSERGLFTADVMRRAVAEVIDNKRPVREVARDMGLSRATIARYLKDTRLASEKGTPTNFKKTHVTKQVFSFEQERSLAEYVVKCSKMFHGLSIKQTRRLAWQYAKANLNTYPSSWDENQEAGIDWFYGLMKRNPDLSLRMPEATSIARSTGFNRQNVNLFFEQYQGILARPNFSQEPNRLWNLDETGVKTVADPTRVISQKGLKQVGQISSSERGVLVTMCCCVNAVGTSLPPAYIFPRVNFKDHMLNDAPNGSLGLANPSGWMNSELFPVVLKHFIKHMNVSKDNPALLVMDNHESHLGIDTIDTARDSGLIILTFPPHCSHKLQPLDVSVYGPFKRYYNAACNDWMLSHPGRAITIYDIGSLSAQAYYKAFTPSNIVAGFSKTGIYPLNMNIFPDDVFLSAAPTDRPLNEAQPEPTVNPAPQPTGSTQPPPTVNPAPQPTGSTQPPPTVNPAPKPTGSTQPPPTVNPVPQPPGSTQPPPTQPRVNPTPQPSTSAESQTILDKQPQPSSSAQGQSQTTIDPLTQISANPPPHNMVDAQPPSNVQAGSPTTYALSHSSTSIRQATLSPEIIRPFPQAPERKQTNSRKRVKSTVVTDTPERNRIAAEKEKKNTRCSRGLFHTDGADVRASDSYDSTSDEEQMTFQKKEPEPGDYVIVKYSMKRSVAHFIGIIMQPKDDEGDFEIKFLRRSTRHSMSYAFVEPEREEISSVESSSILGVLPYPVEQTTKRLKGITQFNINFDGYNLQ